MNDPESELAALLPRLVRSQRVHYLDNLRSALIALVIFHHAALPFGGLGSDLWMYRSPYQSAAPSRLILGAFIAVNQTYFMGTLFFLSGHFSAIAASRKSWQAFCVDKLKRLGIPVVVFSLFMQPLIRLLAGWSQHAHIWRALLGYWAGLRGATGPVWFLATLLCFDLVYITIHTCLPSFAFLRPTSAARYKATAAVCIGIVIASSFSIRLSYPVGRTIPPVGVQLAYTPQYVFAYIAGISLSALQQYILVPHPGRALALAYLGAIATFLLTALLSRSSFHLVVGGANPLALAYAIWNEVCFFFIGTALLSFFHESPYTTRQWGNSARYSYGAFLLHSLVVVTLQILVDRAEGRLVAWSKRS
ncbi:acyltransferase 3 [Mycena sp. CBHHK59/15]|nr:acyltransferase 3 [Mycena sp. CBHHK59/15]